MAPPLLQKKIKHPSFFTAIIYRLLYIFLLNNVNLTDCLISTFKLQMAKLTFTLKKKVINASCTCIFTYRLCWGQWKYWKDKQKSNYWPDFEDIQKERFPILILESHWRLKIEIVIGLSFGTLCCCSNTTTIIQYLKPLFELNNRYKQTKNGILYSPWKIMPHKSYSSIIQLCWIFM